MPRGGKKQARRLNYLVQNVMPRYINLKRNEFELHYSVMNKLFNRLHGMMKQVDPYYEKYSSTTSYAGSHLDSLKITKPDEFDIIFAVKLPLCDEVDRRNPARSDIVLEPQDAGYIQLKMGRQFDRLPQRDDFEVNRIAYGWADDEDYLLRSKFKDWFKGVVAKAFNHFDMVGTLPTFRNNGKVYTIRRTGADTGPAVQLVIEDASQEFLMDVDLVPALRFPETRWPVSRDYKPIPSSHKKAKQYWVVVPKANKRNPDDEVAMNRSWRIGLQNQEAELMFDKHLLKPTIRLMKKLRDSLEMDKIASYYIKTLFFWELEKQNDSFWVYNPGLIFKTMVQRLHDALYAGEIRYYWNRNYNFIENLDRSILNGYCNKLQVLLEALKEPFDLEVVAESLLSPEEFDDYLRRH